MPCDDVANSTQIVSPVLLVTQIYQPFQPPVVRAALKSERAGENRIGLDEIGRRVPLPSADVPALNHHENAMLVAAHRLPLLNLAGDVGLDAGPTPESPRII